MGQQNYLLENVKATAPRNEVGTGTIGTNKLGLLGSGTLFKTELERGAYIVNFTTDEIIKVVEVVSDTYAILESQFSTEIPAASQMDYIPKYKSNARSIAAIIPVYQQDNTTENTWGTINGAETAPGIGVNADKGNRDRSSSMDVVSPMIMDATGTQILVTITY